MMTIKGSQALHFLPALQAHEEDGLYTIQAVYSSTFFACANQMMNTIWALLEDALVQVAAELQKAVSRHLHGLTMLRNLRGMVEHMQKAGPLPSETGNDGSYFVELLDLSIQ